MKCDLCSAQHAVQYEVEYGWLQKVVTHLSHEKVIETAYRPIGVLSRSACSDCARDYLRKYERWRRLGCWLGPIILVLLFQLMFWIERSWDSVWSILVWILFVLVIHVFSFWSFWAIVTLVFRLFDRDAAIKEAIESDIWRSNVDRLREDLHKLEPHFIFHPNRDRSGRSIHNQPGRWHYCESGGPTYKYFVKPRGLKAKADWIH